MPHDSLQQRIPDEADVGKDGAADQDPFTVLVVAADQDVGEDKIDDMDQNGQKQRP